MPVRVGRCLFSLAAVALTGFGVEYATASNIAADTELEQVLLTSGFKAKAANTPAQRAQLRAMPDNQFAMVKQNPQLLLAGHLSLLHRRTRETH